jgi:glycosyltransferase involved in cell wall biosynthesis
MNPFKVIMVVDYYPPLIEGIGDYTANLLRALSNRGVGVTVVTRPAAGANVRELSGPIDIRRIGNGWRMSAIGTILQVLDEKGPGAILHVQYPSGATYHKRPMINLLPAIVRVARPRVPVVVTMHEYHEHRLRWKVRAIPMMIAAHGLILVNSKDYRTVTRRIRPPKFHTDLIPIGSNIEVVPESPTLRNELRKQYGFTPGDAIIVYFGDMHPGKGFLELLSALRQLRSEGLAVSLLIISRLKAHKSLYDRKILAALESPIREKWAYVADAPEPDKVSRHLQLADAAVFPFTRGAAENRGSLLAAIAHGLPTLTTRGPSTPARFEENFGVQTVPAGDLPALTAWLRALVQSPDLRDHLSARARVARKAFSWDDIAQRVIGHYQSVSGSQPNAV